MASDNEKEKTAWTFNQSFRPAVNRLKPKEACSLKRHFRNVLYEVVGILDKLAKRNDDRFVFASIRKLMKECNKNHNNKHERIQYSERAVKYALAKAREFHVISKQVQRVRNGVTLSGWIVAPHDALCERAGATCVFKGQLRVPGKWVRSEDRTTVFWVPKTAPATAPATAPPTAPQKQKTAPIPEKNCTDHCTDGAGQTLAEHADATIEEKFRPTFPPSILVSQPYEPNKPVEPPTADQSKNDANSVSVTDKPTTVEDQFGNLVGEELIAAITDGALCSEKSRGPWDRKKYPHWKQLKKASEQAVENMRSEPFIGRITCASIMRTVMNILLATHRAKVPKPWLPIMDELKLGGPMRTMEAREHTESLDWENMSSPVHFFTNVAQEAGIEIDVLEVAEPKLIRNTYREGWKRLSEYERLSEPFLKLRDWLWDHDTSPEKPETRPWDA